MVDGVPQDKHSLSLMGRPDFARAKYSCRCVVTHAFQLSEDILENTLSVSGFAGDDSLDVFEEDDSWLALLDPFEDEGEEVSGVFGCFPASCVAEWLAGESASEDVHASTKLSEWEFFKVREHRARIHLARFHLRNQVRGCEGFDLHMSDFSHIWENSSESNSDPFVSATEGQVSDMFFGIIHIHYFLSFFVFYFGLSVSLS